MAAPYVVTFGEGGVGLRRAERRGLARRASAKDPSSSALLHHPPPIRRQKTEDHSRQRERSPASPPANSAQRPRPTSSTSKYVRRGSSSELGVHLEEVLRHRAAIPRLPDAMHHLLELFTAVEQDDIGKVRALLQRASVDVNAVAMSLPLKEQISGEVVKKSQALSRENLEDVTALDVATMLNHAQVAQLLLQRGAQENPRYASVGARERKLQALAENASRKLAQIRLASSQSLGQGPGTSAGLQGLSPKELERQTALWESRLHLINKMRTNFAAALPPPPPRPPALSVASDASLLLSLDAPPNAAAQPPHPVTKYLVEWSSDPAFATLDGSLVVRDLRRTDVTIPSLVSGQAYFVRLSAGNFRGFGKAVASRPASLAPSSWRSVVPPAAATTKAELSGLRELHDQVKALRLTESWERLFPTAADPNPVLGKKKKTSLRNLFSASTKFQKSLKKGVYLATVLYKDDKVLCTVDEQIPMVLVDENAPKSVQSDFNWLMKVSVCWEEGAWLGGAESAGAGSESVAFRLRLLEAAAEMQSALGATELGRLHAKPLQQGPTTVFLTTAYVPDLKAVQGLAVRWLPLPKLLRRHQTALTTKAVADRTPYELLLAGLVDQLNFYESTYVPLDKGLYLAYLKLSASLNDGISILVPENLPSVLPFVFLRSNPHVSREEWEWVQRLATEERPQASPAQLSFHWSLCSAANILLQDLEVGTAAAQTHRLYRLEVMEIHPEVSFLVIVPGPAEVVSGPSNGSEKVADGEEKRGCLSIPVPVFELAHLCTYQPDFIGLYCRLSAFLDHFLLLLTQLQRQAFSKAETSLCKSHLDKLSGFQSRLEEVWRAARWISAVTSKSRERNPYSDACLSLATILNFSPDAASPSAGSAAGGSGAGQEAGGGEAGGAEEDSVEGGGEDQSSDVGYHSDQSSGERKAAAAAALAAAGLSADLSVSPPLASPPDTADLSSVTLQASPPKKPPRLELTPELPPSGSTGPMSPLPPTSAKSFLQPLAVQKRFSTASLSSVVFESSSAPEQHLAPVHEPSNATSIPESGTEPSTSAQSEAGDTESLSHHSTCSSPPQTGGRAPSEASTGHVSDTELLARFRSEAAGRSVRGRPIDSQTARTNNVEDLSHIDALYASFAASRPKPSPVAQPTPSVSPSGGELSPLRGQAGGVSPMSGGGGGGSPSASLRSGTSSPLAAGILRVFAAYPCGLSRGTSVKLQATPRTTARELVGLVVQQLRRAALAKGVAAPELSKEDLGDFVLVVVIGARERVLRDDFPPLQLQNPWAKGKLFVRRRHDLLAALEFGNEAQV